MPTKRSVQQLEVRILLYKRFLPDWPALIESFERELETLHASGFKPLPIGRRRTLVTGKLTAKSTIS